MRITIDIRLLVKGGASGIEEYTLNLLQALLAINSENEYALFYNGFRKQSFSAQTPRSFCDRDPNSLSPRAIPNYQIIDWKIPNRLFDFSSRFFREPKIDRWLETDLVFSPHFNILAVAKAPRVITFHDLSFIHHPYFFSRKQKIWHWLQDIKRQAYSADKIIAVSQFTKNDLVNTFGIKPEKIEVIYSGIASEFNALASVPRSLSEERNDGRPYILYLGTLEPRKNIEAIIRAFNLLKAKTAFGNFCLILAGRPGWLYGNILKEAARSLFRQDIIFYGPVSSVERAGLYRGAQVFVYPSFFEGFGFPPLEAQAGGCPVVAANRASLPEILGDSALFADPWRVEDLASAIELLIMNKIKRHQFIEAGLKNANRFQWPRAAQATLDVFKSFGP